MTVFEDKRATEFASSEPPHSGLEALIRKWPIRWRVMAIAILNCAVVLILAAFIWDGARVLNSAWSDLRDVRESDRVLVAVETEASRLQSLIHRYFNQPTTELFNEVTRRREALVRTLKTRAALDAHLSGSVEVLLQITERFVAGFEDLRTVQATISRMYENEVIKTAREITSLYAIVDSAVGGRSGLLGPALGKSREAFSAALLAANAYYLSVEAEAASEAQKNLATIENTVPVLLDLAENELQRGALSAIGNRVSSMRSGLAHLSDSFATQTRLLRENIDGTQLAMSSAIDELAAQMRTTETRAQERFDAELRTVYRKVVFVAVAFFAIIILISLAVAGSISIPLAALRDTMQGITSGDYARRVSGLDARDEIGEMARAVEVFRENAIARRRAEGELRASKERAEVALSELRDAQENLVEAEKLAALGGLVAGVAHEVNNPVGISLTVASSLVRRCEVFAEEVASGQMRRARLVEFVEGNRDAAVQLVANLQRAGELIQSFKQVAVDRSHAERRPFDLRESTEQIVSSLRPGLKQSRIALDVHVPDGIIMESYPGPYGQVLTNLTLNAITHAFPHGASGHIRIDAQKVDGEQVEIVFQDDGAGMTEEVQRQAFEPFFTTRRGQGGTGLGLHIVYNLVTRRLGGRITFHSVPGRGTRFRITLPLTAPRDDSAGTGAELQYAEG